MRGAALVFFCCVAAQAASQEIKVKCERYDDFPPESNKLAPSLVVDVKLETVTVAGEVMLNISWAINIDASNRYLIATRIVMPEQDYHCEYDPPLASVQLNNLNQIWFHYLVSTVCGTISVQVANLPLPPVVENTLAYKASHIEMSCSTRTSVRQTSPRLTTAKVTTELTAPAPRIKHVVIIIIIIFVGGVAGLFILSLCCIIYKSRSNTGVLLDYKNIPVVPVPVLVVYPAVNSSFQRAVVAFAEFLQWHGGCRVAIDIWQQEKIAQQGPMRWLAEQAKSADHVLVVSPQVATLSHCLPDPTLPESSIPAAAHDLYPLILNMVASHAKNASELAKFSVVQLGEQQDKSSCMLPLELRFCQMFCLMKDLKKLCKHLHGHKQNDKKMLNLLCRRGVSYSEKNTVKLRETVEKLRGHQVKVSRELQPLNSVVSRA